MIIYKLHLSLQSQRGLEMINSMETAIDVAAMYAASRIVVKLFKCVYTSILDSTIIESIEICFIHMKCDIGASLCVFKTYFK